MDVYRFVVPLGIATYLFLLATILTGLLRRRFKFRYHKTLALITISLATLHAGVILYSTYWPR